LVGRGKAARSPWASILFGFTLAAGCGGPGPNPVTNVDCEVFETVLADFRMRDEFIGNPVWKEARRIVLDDKTSGFADTRVFPKEIPLELIADIVRRNPRRVHHSLKQYTPKNANILGARPDGRGHAARFLPGAR